mmetsp:Transcript_3873/g.9149  ORF Transcript_3873/g.9149 Transcript_3873/m.9149 type:complete len:213 (+) Transcript_3873:1786-2424(+)
MTFFLNDLPPGTLSKSSGFCFAGGDSLSFGEYSGVSPHIPLAVPLGVGVFSQEGVSAGGKSKGELGVCGPYTGVVGACEGDDGLWSPPPSWVSSWRSRVQTRLSGSFSSSSGMWPWTAFFSAPAVVGVEGEEASPARRRLGVPTGLGELTASENLSSQRFSASFAYVAFICPASLRALFRNSRCCLSASVSFSAAGSSWASGSGMFLGRVLR